MKCFLFLLTMMAVQLVASQTVKLSELEGKWFVNRSNFPMWLKGTKINPTFNYSLVVKHGKPLLLDEVRYTENSKTKSITGYDKSLNENNNSFVWRGKGILSFTKSKWKILHFDNEQQWMIIHFERTLFSPEGYDVVSKSKIIEGDLEKEVMKKLTELGIAGKLTVIQQE